MLTSLDGTSITHDEIGNPITYGNYTINWNGRRLESINWNDTEVLSYEYNIDGQRVSKTYEGVTTEYFYNGSILAGEKTGNNVIIYMYDNNGDIFGFTYNGTEYYYIKNAQNDVVAIADASGNVVVRYYYNAWGEIIDCVDNTTFGLSSINPITYRSYYNDNIVGMDMYYLNSRYYMADWGRFASADTTDILSVQSDLYDKNLFAYCDNNPVHRIDASGYAWETIFDVASLCLSMAEVAVNPADAWAWIGLAADFVDLVPFVTGLGEVVRAVKVSNKAIDAVDTVSDAKKIINSVDTAKDTIKRIDLSAPKIHGNSLKTTKTNYGYALLDNNKNIMKFGETLNPTTRYSKKYLTNNGLTMEIIDKGSKADIHYWQYDMNMYFKSRYGSFPPLNKRGW